MGPVIRNVIRDCIRPVMGDEALVSRFSPAVRDYFSRLDAAGLRVTAYDAANARLIDRLVANGGNFWPDSGAFCAMAGYLFPVEDPSIPPLYNQRMYFDGVNDYVSSSPLSLSGVKELRVAIQFYYTGQESTLLSQRDSFSTQDLYIDIGAGNKLRASLGTSASIASFTSTETVSPGAHTLVINFDSTQVVSSDRFTVELDGVLLSGTGGSVSFDQTLTENSTALEIGVRESGAFNFKGIISDIEIDVGGVAERSYQGYGNTNADWEDQVGTNDGTVNGSPALFTGQGIPGSTLVPLHPNHDAGTLNNFVTGDWNAVTGLKGDGSTKYVDSNRNNNADGQDDFSMGVYIETIASFVGGSPGYIGTNPSSGGSNLGRLSSNSLLLYGSARCSTQTAGSTPAPPTTGYLGLTRNTSTGYVVRHDDLEITDVETSATPLDVNIRVLEAFGKSDARLPFYHIGPNLSGAGELAELDTILTDWKTDLANA